MDSALFPKRLPFLAAQELRDAEACNDVTAEFGLRLSPDEIRELCARHAEALRNTGRVELGSGVLPQLAEAFAGSPYLAPREYAATLGALLELFYQLKNDYRDRFSDAEVIAAMAALYNGAAHGSVEYLADAALQGELLEEEREECEWNGN